MIRLVRCVAVLVVLGGCAQPVDTSKRDANPDKYSRDRDLCQAQINEMMRTRRAVDDSRRDVFSGQQDRYGWGALPTQMENLGDRRSSDRIMADCMEARGWPQARPEWWRPFGS